MFDAFAFACVFGSILAVLLKAGGITCLAGLSYLVLWAPALAILAVCLLLIVLAAFSA